MFVERSEAVAYSILSGECLWSGEAVAYLFLSGECLWSGVRLWPTHSSLVNVCGVE